jgi:hypothetical protein
MINGRHALPLVAARHVIWAQRDRAREFIWGDKLGYEPRIAPPNRMELVDPERPEPPAAASPSSACVGALDTGTALAECGRFLGLSVEEVQTAQASSLIERALSGGWPLLGATPAAVASLDERGWGGLAAFLRGGRTLFLAGFGPASNPILAELGRRLGLVQLAAEAPQLASSAVLFPGEAVSFAHELAGVRVESALQASRLGGGGSARALCFNLAGEAREGPSVVEQRAGAGRIVLSSFPARLPGTLARCFGPEQSPLFLPPMMLLRELYGEAAWRPPAQLANFTVDDPALREGLLGLPYSRAARLAREHGFHVTVATIPAELGLAQPAVVAQLQESPTVISACYHGCDHDGYEFYRTEGRGLRYIPRPLDHQRAALRRAVDYGTEFAGRLGYELDRVMVFPHGLGPAAILSDLHELGFVATSNMDNRYPLEAPRPDERYLGLRPADTAWSGFPLLWRREISDAGYLLDLFIGRPALTFEHRSGLGQDFAPFVSRAEEIRSVTRGSVVWRSLDEVARHAYLQRREPHRGWEVLMTSNEICLHNPGRAPRSYCVWRPDLPAGAAFQVDGGPATHTHPFEVEVPAGGAAVVRVLPGGEEPTLGRRLRCSVFATSQGR